VQFEMVQLGRAILYRANCLEVMPLLHPVNHIITDPPYEQIMHEAKANGRKLRQDRGPELKALGFESIDTIRAAVIEHASSLCEGWFIAFCTPEGVAKWADVINASPMKYKRACAWVKPDATPQMNGQGPAAGFENFICAWAGSGFSKWNAGGKRGVYTHYTNPPERDGRHTTEKPRRLMSEIVADFTMPGQTILDPFMGSDSTGVAAVMAHRDFIGIEADPEAFAWAVERIENAQRQLSLI
jgi:site-specific DNA-methyltransferase (adenine-specific)